MTHNFADSLAKSHTASDMPFWEEYYKKFFPTMIAFLDHRQDGNHQRQGIDRSVILANGKRYWIDEKVRFKNAKTGKVYEDIALEEWSNEERKILGWAEKPLLCDYIAYAIAPLGKCYLLPVEQMQAAWLKNKAIWKNKYQEIRAINQSWITVSWGIPWKVLFCEIWENHICTFTPV